MLTSSVQENLKQQFPSKIDPHIGLQLSYNCYIFYSP